MTAIYKKVKNRYVEIGRYEDEHLSHYPHGVHLVLSMPGSRLTRFQIEPEIAGLLAAAEIARPAMMEAMRNANHYRPSGPQGRPLTKREQKAWAAYKAIAGEESCIILQGASMHDIVDAGFQRLIEVAREKRNG